MDFKHYSYCEREKTNTRMELLRKVASCGASIEDLKTIYILFVRSILEQSATVWHSLVMMILSFGNNSRQLVNSIAKLAILEQP